MNEFPGHQSRLLDTEHTHACPFAPYRKYCRLLFLQPVSPMNPSLHWQSFCRAKVADLVVANLVGAFIPASRLVDGDRSPADRAVVKAGAAPGFEPGSPTRYDGGTTQPSYTHSPRVVLASALYPLSYAAKMLRIATLRIAVATHNSKKGQHRDLNPDL